MTSFKHCQGKFASACPATLPQTQIKVQNKTNFLPRVSAGECAGIISFRVVSRQLICALDLAV
jgi:hypothetical protein